MIPTDVVRTTSDGVVMFWCPGCETYHGVWTTDVNPLTGARWSWNGDRVRPTFSPSVLVHGNGKVPHCHSWVRDGVIEFLGDCSHPLAGLKVGLMTNEEVDRQSEAGTLFRDGASQK